LNHRNTFETPPTKTLSVPAPAADAVEKVSFCDSHFSYAQTLAAAVKVVLIR
jgi:hypothetical protein